MNMKRYIQLLVLAGLPALGAGCSVDVNTGEGEEEPPPTPECPAAERATVRFMHAAGGTPVTRPEFGPATTRSLIIVRSDLASEPTIATMTAGRGAYAQICGNKQVTLGARLQGAEENRVELMITLTPDADPSRFDAGRTIVIAGIADTLVNGVPENPKSVADPLRFIEVPDMFGTGSDSLIQVVHASRRVPTPIDVEANPDRMGVEVTALARYTASTPQPTKGTADTAPAAVPVTFLEGTTSRATFNVAPRIPAGAKALAILFDTEVFDPGHPDPASRNPAPVSRLFLTGDDPLLGFVAGAGVTF